MTQLSKRLLSIDPVNIPLIALNSAVVGSMKQFLNLISLSEEGPDRGQEGRAGRQGAGVRGGDQEEGGQTGAAGGGGGPEE